MKIFTALIERKRLLLRSAACGFILAATVSMFPFAASCQALPENVLRLHVVANSDSPEDQAVKLKVRDAVLSEAAGYCKAYDEMQQASNALCLHLQAVQAAANRVLRENGFAETAKVQITDSHFPTRRYDGFTLPAGKYRTLRVTLGEGAGENWWCVVFPSLCLPAAGETAELLSSLPANEREVIANPQKYRVKFKAFELYEQIRCWLTREK